jgi:hypothetical protein
MDFREMMWDNMDWISLAQDRDQRRALMNTVMNLRVPYYIGIFASTSETSRFLKKDSVPCI